MPIEDVSDADRFRRVAELERGGSTVTQCVRDPNRPDVWTVVYSAGRASLLEFRGLAAVNE